VAVLPSVLAVTGQPGTSNRRFADVVMATTEQQIAGALLLTGRYGEPIWTRHRFRFRSHYRDPFARRPYGARPNSPRMIALGYKARF